ncbi:MAG: hypothetical protein COZ37_04660 [bacterium (Candidatus Ratteibacteria) CG_4_10_14_3_um_filter_41_18]|uniref:Uncharacterized protein n=1 Tax=bacterium (Candidatus Ratteibacteria) CG_4_10_14_3_um_filter_41_18 TaxID=2014287 RepID=A0A2M7M2Y0_9BACT|nr:MAG: hypothetical protein COZ37_04660 [bacterium (Candidatus Ratteibacteria) CG_4_10_14_3_um_filter_41_18]
MGNRGKYPVPSGHPFCKKRGRKYPVPSGHPFCKKRGMNLYIKFSFSLFPSLSPFSLLLFYCNLTGKILQ